MITMNPARASVNQCSCECDGLKTILKSLNVDNANSIFIALNQRKSLKNTKISGTEFDRANDLYQEIQVVIFVIITPFYFLMIASKSSIIIYKRFCLIVSCREKQLEENWHLRMFVIWSEYIEVWVYWKTPNSCFIFIMVQEILPGNFSGANCCRFK